MAAGDIEVRINSETKAFKLGVEQGIIDPLEDAEKALEELGRSRGPEELERELRDAQKQTEKLADETKDTARQIERSYKDAGRDIKKGVGDGLKDAKDEAAQSGREAAASFSGEWSDVGDFVQETVANGLSGFGPLGLAAGIAAAAGIGVLTETILGQQDAADELKARLSDAYRTAAEEGRTYIDTAQIIAEASDLMFNKDRADEWKQVQEDAKMLGLDVYDVVAANAGEAGKQRDVQERINALLDDQSNYHETLREGQSQLNLDVESLRDRWSDVIDATKEEKENAAQLADVVKRTEEEHRDQIKRTRDADQARYEALAERYSKPFKATVDVDVNDRTGPGVDRIVRRINGRVASIQIGGRFLE